LANKQLYCQTNIDFVTVTTSSHLAFHTKRTRIKRVLRAMRIFPIIHIIPLKSNNGRVNFGEMHGISVI